MLVATEVTGVVRAEERADVADEAAAGEDGAADEAAWEVDEPSPEPEVASPVTVEITGFEDAWFEPTVAYALPSWRLKNGRG